MRPAIVAVGIAAAVAAGGTGLLLSNYMQRTAAPHSSAAPKKPATLGVLVAASPIAPGTPIEATMLQWQQWPQALAEAAEAQGAVASPPAGEATAGKPFVGAVARIAILKGEILTLDKVARLGDKGSTLAYMIAPGDRAMTVRVTPVTAAGGMIQPGDRVDLLLTTDLTDKGAGRVDPVTGRMTPKLATETFLRNLRVLADDRRLDVNQAKDAPMPTNLTLEVSPEQAERIATADRMGKLWVVLRSAENGPSPSRQGPIITTDLQVVPDLRAARMGTTPAEMDQKADPFVREPPPAPKARKDDSSEIIIYRWTQSSKIPVSNGHVVGGAQGLTPPPPPPPPPPSPPAPPALSGPGQDAKQASSQAAETRSGPSEKPKIPYVPYIPPSRMPGKGAR